MNSRGIVFLDRDGTINVDSGYVCRPQDLVLIGGAATAIADLKRAGFAVVVISNQSAIGRGMASAEQVDSTNAELVRQLRLADPDAILDQIIYSPSTPDDNSDCRKPKTGMLQRLSSQLEFDAKKSWMVGDKISDIEFGVNAGICFENCLLVQTGEGEKSYAAAQDKPIYVSDLLAATKLILSSLSTS